MLLYNVVAAESDTVDRLQREERGLCFPHLHNMHYIFFHCASLDSYSFVAEILLNMLVQISAFLLSNPHVCI